MTTPSDWTDVLPADVLKDGVPKMVRVGTRRVAVLKHGERLSAFDDLCPHASDPLSQGYPFEGAVICRAHGWRYELSDGRCTMGDRDSRLPIHDVRIADGRVEVRLR